jgi:hypothetical protein
MAAVHTMGRVGHTQTLNIVSVSQMVINLKELDLVSDIAQKHTFSLYGE